MQYDLVFEGGGAKRHGVCGGHEAFEAGPYVGAAFGASAGRSRRRCWPPAPAQEMLIALDEQKDGGRSLPASWVL